MGQAIYHQGSTDLIDGPRNTVVIVGQRMEMNCQTDDNSIIREWSFQRPVTQDEEPIFKNWLDRKNIFNPHFGIAEGSDGSITGLLYTNSTEMEDAGIYTCTVQKVGSQPQRYSAHLIVFETEPLCETNLSFSKSNIFEEKTHIWMQCAINVTGSWAPDIEWRLNEGNGDTQAESTDLTDWSKAIVVPNNTIVSTLIVALNASSNSSYFSSRVYFTSAHCSQLVTANNTPVYHYKWRSPLVKSLPNTAFLTLMKGMAVNDSVKSIDVLNPTIMLTAVAVSAFAVLSVAVIIFCICRKRHTCRPNRASKTGLVSGQSGTPPDPVYAEVSAAKVEENEADLNTDDYENVATDENPSHAATYMELTSLTKDSPSVYARIDTAGKMRNT